MKYQNIFEMVEKFAALTEETVYKTPITSEFMSQRERLSKFQDHFSTILKTVIHELGGEIWSLKERKFNKKMLKLLAKVYTDLIQINKEIDPHKPYIAAEKLVHYVTERPNAPIIDNLDFLAKHHLNQTAIGFSADVKDMQPNIRSIDTLKSLAMYLRNFMSNHPLLTPPAPLNLPTPKLQENLEDVPSFFAGKEEETKA